MAVCIGLQPVFSHFVPFPSFPFFVSASLKSPRGGPM